jgi:hypothetical protein
MAAQATERGFLRGYDTGVIGGAMPLVQKGSDADPALTRDRSGEREHVRA